MLSQQLKELAADGLVRRIELKAVPPHVEYELTTFGRDLCGTMQRACEWGVRNMGEIARIAETRVGAPGYTARLAGERSTITQRLTAASRLSRAPSCFSHTESWL